MKQRFAFTLVELLLVIAVIAVLAGMLLPALGRVREIGYSAFCRNSMRQVALMHFQYANAFNGYFCPAHDAEWNQWDSSADHKKAGILAAALPEGDAVKGKVFECPTARKSGMKFKNSWTAQFAGFGYNYLLTFKDLYHCDPSKPRGLKMEGVRRSAACLLLADTAYFSSPGVLSPTAFLYYPSSGSGGYADFRHLARCNSAFVDGHVSENTKLFPASGCLTRVGYLSFDDSAYDPEWRE